MVQIEPSDDDLASIENETEEPAPAGDEVGALEDLFAEAVKANPERKLRKAQRSADPALRQALDATAKKMRELYTNPENWKAARGLVLIDAETQTVLGNYREYLHATTTARRLVRQHQPITIDGQEVVEGFLGHQLEERIRGIRWDEEREITLHVSLDEVQVEAPNARLKVCLLLHSILRAELAADTQFASSSGNVLLLLPAGTNVWEAASTDTKAAMRKAVL